MRWLFVLVFSAALLVPSSFAQEFGSSQLPKKVTYFLFDASGSMRGKAVQAEAAASERLAQILSADPKATISRTYFRAKDRKACWERVKISEPVPAVDSKPETVQFYDDFTPLGAALEAAILRAGSGPADIFLFSDESQTEHCGIDICDVARAYLPRAGINVHSIPVGSTPRDHDRLGCIEGIQGSPPPEATSLTGPTVVERSSVTPPDVGNGPHPSILERWAWLIAFVCVAGSCAAIGYKHSYLAVYLENQTNEARSLRDLIRHGDASAASKIRELGVETDKKTTSELPSRGIERWLSVTNVVFLFGALSLVLLAALPDDASFGSFHVANAKASAWAVLNSDFSTAFAVTWIAIIFFAGSQDQRRREAQRSFAIATNEAQRIAEAQESASRRKAYEDYLEICSTIANFEFDPPASDSNDFEDLETASDFEIDFARVAQETIRVAIGDTLSANADEAALAKRTIELKSLTTYRPRLFGSGSLEQPDLSTFIGRIRKLHPFPEDDAEWENLAKVLASGLINEIKPRIHHLAGRIF